MSQHGSLLSSWNRRQTHLPQHCSPISAWNRSTGKEFCSSCYKLCCSWHHGAIQSESSTTEQEHQTFYWRRSIQMESRDCSNAVHKPITITTWMPGDFSHSGTACPKVGLYCAKGSWTWRSQNQSQLNRPRRSQASRRTVSQATTEICGKNIDFFQQWLISNHYKWCFLQYSVCWWSHSTNCAIFCLRLAKLYKPYILGWRLCWQGCRSFLQAKFIH